MLFTISLVILALGFGGLLFVTGIIPALLSSYAAAQDNRSDALVSIGAFIGIVGAQFGCYLSLRLVVVWIAGGHTALYMRDK